MRAVDCEAFVSKSSAQPWHNGEAVRSNVTLEAHVFDPLVAPTAASAGATGGSCFGAHVGLVARRGPLYVWLIAWSCMSLASLSACSLVFPAELSHQAQDAMPADAEVDADGMCSAPYVCLRFARREIRNDPTGVSEALETLPYDPQLLRMEAAVNGSDWQSLEKVGAGTYRFARPSTDTPYRIGFQLAADPALHANTLLPREMFGSQPAPIAFVEYIGRRDRDILPASSTASVAITSTKFETAFLFTTGLWSRTSLNGTHSGGAYQVKLANTNHVSPRGIYDVRKGDRLYLIDWGKPTAAAAYSRILRYAEPAPDFSNSVNVAVAPALVSPSQMHSAIFNDAAGSEAARVAGLQGASQALTTYEIGAVVAPNAGELGFLPLASGSAVAAVVEYANPLRMQTIVHRLLVSLEQPVPRVGGGAAISVKKVTQHTYLLPPNDGTQVPAYKLPPSAMRIALPTEFALNDKLWNQPITAGFGDLTLTAKLGEGVYDHIVYVLYRVPPAGETATAPVEVAIFDSKAPTLVIDKRYLAPGNRYMVGMLLRKGIDPRSELHNGVREFPAYAANAYTSVVDIVMPSQPAMAR